jgi:hypothetical protein
VGVVASERFTSVKSLIVQSPPPPPENEIKEIFNEKKIITQLNDSF